MGSLAAHRGDRAEATGLFHPFSHSAPPSPPSFTPSCSLMLTHFVSHSMPASLAPPSRYFLVSLFSRLPPQSTVFASIEKKLPHVIFSWPVSSPYSSSCTGFLLTAFFFHPAVFLFSSSAPSAPPPCVSPLNSHVRCGAAVFTKHEVLHVHPAPGFSGVLFVCVCAWEKGGEGENKKKEGQQPRECFLVY